MHFNSPAPSAHAVRITHRCLEEMSQLIRQCGTEIGWFCLVQDTADGPILSDTIVLEQRVSGVTTEIDEFAIGIFCGTLMDEPGGIATINAMRTWGHSHVNMGTGPSGQDQTQMHTFSKQYAPDLTYRIIGNKQGHLRIDIYGANGTCIHQDVGFYPTGNPLTPTQIEECAQWAAEHIRTCCHPMSWRHPEAPKVTATFPASLWPVHPGYMHAPQKTPAQDIRQPQATQEGTPTQGTETVSTPTPWWRRFMQWWKTR